MQCREIDSPYKHLESLLFLCDNRVLCYIYIIHLKREDYKLFQFLAIDSAVIYVYTSRSYLTCVSSLTLAIETNFLLEETWRVEECIKMYL
jgi:hypothetical protein